LKDQYRQFEDLLSLLKKLPPPPKRTGYEGMLLRDHRKIPCSLCEKIISVSECKRLNTGIVHAIDAMCKACRVEVKGTCPLVCIRCERVVSRMEPGRDSKTGFVFTKNRPYHLDGCPFCEDNLDKSIILEKLMYEKENQ
jgi:hypothetical protein